MPEQTDSDRNSQDLIELLLRGLDQDLSPAEAERIAAAMELDPIFRRQCCALLRLDGLLSAQHCRSDVTEAVMHAVYQQQGERLEAAVQHYLPTSTRRPLRLAPILVLILLARIPHRN